MPISNAQTTETPSDNLILEQFLDDPMAVYVITPTEPEKKSKKIDPELKFDPKFKKKINDMLNAGETRDYDVVILVKKTSENNFIDKSIAKINKDSLEKILQTHNAKNIRKAETLSFVTASVPLHALKNLVNHDYVVVIGDGEEKIKPLLDISRSSIFADTLPYNGTGVIVSVMDTAIRQFHPDMPNNTKIIDQATCFSLGCVPGVTAPTENHGTLVAGIIAGFGTLDPELRGIAANALLLNPVPIFVDDFVWAMEYSVTHGAKIINFSNSLGDPCELNTMANLVVDETVDEGIFFVHAAGNNGTEGFQHLADPGCAYNGIDVGNMNDKGNFNRTDDTISLTSSRGPTLDGRLKPEIVAPGTLINSTDLTSNYGEFSGTSFAAPHVSGAAALILQAQPQYSPLEIKSALLLGAQWNPTNATNFSSTATEYENAGPTDVILSTYGFGYLDASKSLTYANSGKNIILDSISQGDTITYSFSAIHGDQIKVILSWLKHPGGSIIDPEDRQVSNLDFTIKKPDGSVIISNSTNQNNEFAVFNAPITGEYTITISAPLATPATAFNETFALGSTHSLQKGSFLVKEGTFVKAISDTSAQLARPISDITIAGWVSTPLYDKLNEDSPDDTTFVTSPNGTAPQFKVGLGGLTDPETSTGHIIKFRAMTSSGGHAPEQVHATLFQGITPIATTDQNGPEKLSRTEFTEFHYILTAAEADSITDYNDLSIVISTSKGDTEIIQVSWIEFEVPPVPAVQSISGLGFQPKALMLFTTGQTVDGTTDGYQFSIGYSNGITSRSIGISSDDAVPSSNSGRVFGDKVLSILSDGTPTVSAEANLVNFGSDSFTIKWTRNDSTASKIHYVALGGDALTNAQVSSFAAPITPGNQDVVVGFKPDFLMFMHAASTLEASSETHGYISYGFATSSLQRGAIAITSEDHRASTDTWHIQRGDRAIVTLDETSGNIDSESDLVSMNANGFTLNWINAPLDTDRIYYLALKGGGYDVGSFDKVTSSSPVPQIVPSLVSVPKGLILSSVNNIAAIDKQPNNRLSFGASDGVTESSIWVGDQDSSSNAITARSTTDSKIIRIATESATGNSSIINAEADLQPFNTNGFTLNWTTNDSVAKQIIYVAFGDYDLDTGLVGHWKLDENAGLVAIDISGKNNTGTLINEPLWTDGSSCKENNCLNFNGVNSTVIIPDSSTLDGMDALTVSAWVKRDPMVYTGQHIVVGKSFDGLSSDDSYAIYTQGNGGYRARVLMESNAGCDFGAGNDGGDTANFHHLVVMLTDDNHPVSYFDGVKVGDCGGFSNRAVKNTPIPLTFASGADPLDPYFAGTIDNVRIYDRALSDIEILQLFQLGK